MLGSYKTQQSHIYRIKLAYTYSLYFTINRIFESCRFNKCDNNPNHSVRIISLCISYYSSSTITIYRPTTEPEQRDHHIFSIPHILSGSIKVTILQIGILYIYNQNTPSYTLSRQHSFFDR